MTESDRPQEEAAAADFIADPATMEGSDPLQTANEAGASEEAAGDGEGMSVEAAAQARPETAGGDPAPQVDAPEPTPSASAALKGPRGKVDACEDGRVLGWACPRDPLDESKVRVELWIDGSRQAEETASRFRADLLASGMGDGCHAYLLRVPSEYFDGRRHEAEVRDAETGCPLEGCPFTFEFAAEDAAPDAAGAAVEGRVDGCDEYGAHGWAVHTSGLPTPVQLEWTIDDDGDLHGSVQADVLRDDLIEAGVGDGRHGFTIELPDAVYDGAEHSIAVRSAIDGRALRGSPMTFRRTPLELWVRRGDADETERRQIAERALSYLDELPAASVDADTLAQLATIEKWLSTLTPGRLLRRVRAASRRLQALRFEARPLEFASRRRLRGAVVDLWGGAEDLAFELMEDERVVAQGRPSKGPREPGTRHELVFDLPDSLLDESVHRFGLRAQPGGVELGAWSFLLPSPDESRDARPDLDPIWDTTPGVQAARKRRREKAPRKVTPVDTARLRLQDADLDEDDEDGRDQLVGLTLALAHALREAGEWDEAVQHFDRAAALDPESLDAVTGAIRSLLSQGDEAAAEARIEAALVTDPDEPALHSLRDQLMARRRAHRVRTIAFYLPQFHPTPENDEWWGKGFTEWHNVGGAAPQFGGHLQPRRPTALGYYDLRLAETANAQFELARRYGIDGFCYYYYWFEGRRILQRPLDDLASGRTGPFPFCVCWANEDWTRSWDGATGEVLLAQNHAPDSDLQFIQDLAPLLRHPDYIRVDGKPMVLVYRADRLATPKETAEAWREWCREEGIGELYLCAVESFGFYDPRPLGFDAAVEFPPHCPWDRYPDPPYLKTLTDRIGVWPGFNGNVYDYQAFARAAMSRRREPFTLHRTAMAAWDNTARRGKSAAVYHHFSTDTFRNWVMANARRAAVEQPDAVCFINAWNEWAEGTVLEPDVHFGYQNLEAVREVKQLAVHDPHATYWRTNRPLFPEDRLEQRQRVLLIGHDAFPSGAQTNMLNMARTLKRLLDIDINLMLVDGGELLPEFEKIAPTYVIGKTGDWRNGLLAQLRHLSSMGARKAICNTVITGDVCEVLKQEGFKVVGLLHELPTLIEAYGLQSQCWRFADKTDAIVCASRLVADEFAHRYWPDPKKLLVAPQGIAFNRYHDTRDKTRAAVRKELGLAEGCHIVMGCGYGDTRKGVDLFVQAAGELARRRPAASVAFVWVGALDPAVAPYVKADVERLDLEPVFRVTERTPDPARYFIAGDVFTLTSREDPFPSVVMEAFDARMPVVAFEGGGGYVDIVGPATGALVPYLDVPAMVEAVAALLGDDDRRQALGLHNHALCRERFGYAPYMRKLLALLADVPAEQVAAGHLQRQAWFAPGRPRPRITAIVPNFNYARYIELRLRTIASQTLPPDEIIVLDDASTDHSLQVIHAVAADLGIPVQVVTSSRNSGNPFVQWARGLERATGDLVWFAEADDYCEPTLVETLAAEMADEAVVMAWCDSIMVDEAGRGQGAQYKDYYSRNFGAKWRTHFRMDGRALVQDCLFTENVVPNASAVLFRRAAVSFDLAPIQQYRFSGDWWFWLSLARQGEVVYRADPLNYHRRHARSVMGDVLRAGESLLPETMGFYERVLGPYPDAVTPRNARAVIKRMDDLYGMFPALQEQAASVREHPRFAQQWQRLSRELGATAGPQTAQVAGPWLVLSHDVATVPPPDGVRRLLDDTLARRGRVALLATEEQAEAFSKAAGLEEDEFALVDTIEPGRASAPRKPAAVTPFALGRELAGLISPADDREVVSHGLLAHACAATAMAGHTQCWTLVAGPDFDALLGRLPEPDLVELDRLREAMANCGRLEFLGETPPHAMGRLAQQHIKPLERWTAHPGPGSAPHTARRAGRKVLVGFASEASLKEWLAAAKELAASHPDKETRPLMQLLAWGPELGRLREALYGLEGVEVVEVFGSIEDAQQLGDEVATAGQPSQLIEACKERKSLK